jgi:HlyD family secretion protein
MRPAFVRRAVIWSLVALAIVVIGYWATRPQPVTADVGAVTRGDLRVTLDQEGRTRARNKYVVSAPVAGTVQRIALEPGDRVVRGKTEVARILPGAAPLLDPRTRATGEARVKAAGAAVAQAEAALAQARTALEFADRERVRLARLFEGKAVSARDLEAAETEAQARRQAVTAAEAAVAAAKHELELTRAALADGTPGKGAGRVVSLYAPVDGVVLRRVHESEIVVMPGEPLVEIGNIADLEIVADYLSTDAVRIQPGRPALIARWGGGAALHARVRRVEPVGFVKISALGVEEQRVNVILDFADDRESWQGLGDGYRVEVRVIEWEQANLLKVPSSALFRHGEGWAVFALGPDNRVVQRSVEIGRDTGSEAQVLGGLSEGDRVILHPSDRIQDGVLIEPRT